MCAGYSRKYGSLCKIYFLKSLPDVVGMPNYRKHFSSQVLASSLKNVHLCPHISGLGFFCVMMRLYLNPMVYFSVAISPTLFYAYNKGKKKIKK
jgi:hypothetical protein